MRPSDLIKGEKMNEISNRVQNLYHSSEAHFALTTAMSTIGN